MRIAIFFLLLLVLIGAPVLVLFWLSDTPKIDVQAGLLAIGTATRVQVRVTDRHGVRHFTARVEQNGAVFPMYEASVPARRFFFWRGK